MVSHADLTRLSTIKLKNELSRQEKRLDAVLTAFPYLENGTVSLTAQYVGGSEWGERADAKKRIREIKLELIRRGKWNAYVNSAGSDSNSVESKSAKAAAANTREASLRPILKKRGFSIHDWANQARVDFHTADNYLRGRTQPYQSTRKKLADALGLSVEKLPA